MGLTSQPFLVILAAFAAACATEFLSWLLVYRTSNYRRLKEELDRSSKKLEAIKQITVVKANKSNKKEKRLEENMKTSTRDLTATRMKLGLIISATMFLVFNLVSAQWDGIVVAKLPFHPPSFIANITHRGLLGDDVTDCSAAFVYAVSMMYFKLNIAKLGGWNVSRAATRLMSANNAMNVDKYK